jgi:hypothetical protein
MGVGEWSRRRDWCMGVIKARKGCGRRKGCERRKGIRIRKGCRRRGGCRSWKGCVLGVGLLFGELLNRKGYIVRGRGI